MGLHERVSKEAILCFMKHLIIVIPLFGGAVKICSVSNLTSKEAVISVRKLSPNSSCKERSLPPFPVSHKMGAQAAGPHPQLVKLSTSRTAEHNLLICTTNKTSLLLLFYFFWGGGDLPTGAEIFLYLSV